MHTELTNLLPLERIRSAKREYFMRLATVALFALTAVVLGSGALLIPSYLYLNQEIGVRQARLNELDTLLVASKGGETSARLTTLNENATYLARLQTTPSATAVLRAVLAAPRTGIVLSGFTFSPSQKGADARATLTGVATTRETLRAYVEQLSALPFVSNADLPISAYAKESAIPFTITLTGPLMP